MLKAGRGLATNDLQSFRLLKEWNLQDRLFGMCFDSTVIYFQYLHYLHYLHFACYRHIIELLAAAALTANFKPTSPSKELLFKRLKKIWSTINQGNFSICTDVEARYLFVIQSRRKFA